MSKLLVFILVLISFDITAQNVGINNTDPQSTLDIKGSLRLRPQVLNVQGQNAITVPEKTSHLWVDGTPTGDVTITYTFQQEGDIMYISNFTSYHLVMPGAYTVGPGISSIMYIDGEWRPINENNSGWTQTGNSGTNPTQNFIGTTDNQPLIVKTNNTTRMEIKNNGIVGINGSGDLTGIQMGHAVSGKQTDAGKIQYGGFGGNDHVVNIVGGGTDPAGADRKVKIWAEGGTEIIGEIKPNGTAGQANQVLTSNGDGTMQWAAMSSSGEGGAGAGPWNNWCTDNINEYQPVSDENGVSEDFFGNSVSISGDYAIIGTPFDDESGMTDNGSATIFKRNTFTGAWESQVKLFNSNPSSNDLFGYSVFISGDYAIIGAPQDVENGTVGGSATIFKRNVSTGNWESQIKLLNPNAYDFDEFGVSVSISDNYAIVGATGDDEFGWTNCGSASIFKRNSLGGWDNIAKELNQGLSNNDRFGYSVYTSGDNFIIGAPYDDGMNNFDSGSASIYIYDPVSMILTFVAKILNLDEEDDDYFGSSVSLSEEHVIVGCPGDDENSLVDVGSVSIFKFYYWASSQIKLTNSSANTGDNFGTSVQIKENHAIVGSRNDDEGSSFTDNGSTTIFKKYGNQWKVIQKFTHPDSANSDKFGYSVSIDNITRRFLVGAPGVQSNTGMAFFGKVK